ncbi:MAG TPA: peptide deformylase [Pseudobacteroides sp.]|nr:peptide deformylase [Pseudobacteroides sp.]
MAIRIIREDGDEVLRKKAREVGTIDDRIVELVKDMTETMYEYDGVGLAAPQVGILKRIVVIDVGNGPLELINPEIIKEDGEETEIEGCLSVPDVVGEVKRPYKVTVEAKNLKGQDIVVEGEGLLARALCHEIDHLNGVLFTDRAEKIINKSELNNEKRQKSNNKD